MIRGSAVWASASAARMTAEARIRVGGFLEDDVVFLRLGDLADDAVRLLDHLPEFLVAARVHVLPILTLLALELAVEIGEVALLVAALRLGHREPVLLQLVLRALELVGDLAELRLALGELRLEFLLRAQRNIGRAHA